MRLRTLFLWTVACLAFPPDSTRLATAQNTSTPETAALEARLRAMEETNQLMLKELRTLSGQYKAVSEENKALTAKVNALAKRPDLSKPSTRRVSQSDAPPGPLPPGEALLSVPETPDPRIPEPEVTGNDSPTSPPDMRTEVPAQDPAFSARDDSPNLTGIGTVGAAEDDQPPDVRTDEPEPTKAATATESSFLEGFKWESKDGEYQLVFHQETQVDIRAYNQPDSKPVNQVGFYIPRARIIFNGRVTKPIEYSISFSKGFGTLDLLDAYFNFNYNPKLQVRIGRFRVPYTYDWYSLSNQFLTTPERSVFAINYGYNRSTAFMGHGSLFDERVEYAIAGANGPRNFYFDQNSRKDLLAYINGRPFFRSERLGFLKYLNIGGSLAHGLEAGPAFPVTFRTSANATDAPGADFGVPAFLRLNPGVRDNGRRSLWEFHSAYYYKRLTLMAAWDGGYNTYSSDRHPEQVRVPTSGFHVLGSFFVTGEHVERRTFVDPKHPFDLRKGKFGLGALEVQARYSAFHLDPVIFDAGFADGSIWSNSVGAIDAGFNWYLNKYVKVYFDWQHSAFGRPVQFRPGPGGLESTSDLYWLRCQIYF